MIKRLREWPELETVELFATSDLMLKAADALEAASRNERRYLWLRDLGPHGDTALIDVLIMDENEDGPTDVWYRPTPEELDAAVDVALSGEGVGDER